MHFECNQIYVYCISWLVNLSSIFIYIQASEVLGRLNYKLVIL